MTNLKPQEKQESVPARQRRNSSGIPDGMAPTRNRILLVSPFLPFPPESGGIQRTYFLWKALSEIAPVDVVLCNDPYKPGIATSLPASMNFLGRFPWQPKGYSLHRLFKNTML